MARLPCTHLGSIRLSQGLLLGKRTHHQTTAAFPLDPPVMRLEPARTAWLMCHEALSQTINRAVLPSGGQPLRQPRKKLGRHRTDRTPVDKAEEHALCIRAQQPITGYGFGLQVLRSGSFWIKRSGLVVGPGMQVGLGQAAPPDLILKAQHPVGMR